MTRTSHLFVAMLVALLVAMCSARPHESTSAHLLVLKSVDKEHAVAQQNLTVSLNIFNVGQSPAFDVEINDDSDDGLALIDGLRVSTIEKIAPGENVTHTYVVNPLLAGITSSAPAKITYKLEPKGEETREVQSNALSSIAVLTLEEHSRQTAKHYTEWIVFLALSTLLVYAPHHTYKTALKNLSA